MILISGQKTMLKRYKDDIRTIVELSVYLISNVAFGLLLIDGPYFGYLYLLYLAVAYWFYRQYQIYRLLNGVISDLLIFPTQSDNLGQAYNLTVGILIMFWSAVYFFAFAGNMRYSIIAEVTGLFVFLYGFVNVPQGWMELIGNNPKIYNLQGETDIRQLKAIVLTPDKIRLINIYNEIKNVDYLKLDTNSAGKIKGFLQQKTSQNLALILLITSQIKRCS